MVNEGANSRGEFVIDRLNAEQRLDKFLTRLFDNAPRSFIYRMLREKKIKVNGAKADGGVTLKEGDLVKFYLSPSTLDGLVKAREDFKTDLAFIAPDVVYEDDNVIVCDKPVGVLTHAEKKGDADTLTDRVRVYCSQDGFRPSAAHRLDRNTRGVVVFAKNLPSAQWLAKAFRERKVEKFYLAVLEGALETPLRLEWGLTKDGDANMVYADEGGKRAVTEVEPLSVDVGRGFTVARVRLFSGRTHQIRAHLARAGYPLRGDVKYGGTAGDSERRGGYTLCAYSVMFTENDGFLGYLAGRTFTAELPVFLRRYI